MSDFPEVIGGTVNIVIRVTTPASTFSRYGGYETKRLAEVERTWTGEMTWKELAEALEKATNEAKFDAKAVLDHTEEVLRRNSEVKTV